MLELEDVVFVPLHQLEELLKEAVETPQRIDQIGQGTAGELACGQTCELAKGGVDGAHGAVAIEHDDGNRNAFKDRADEIAGV